jgi:hypothetical protein
VSEFNSHNFAIMGHCFSPNGILAPTTTGGIMYTIENAYEAGWEARVQGKPFNSLASKEWKQGWQDSNWDAEVDALTEPEGASA